MKNITPVNYYFLNFIIYLFVYFTLFHFSFTVELGIYQPGCGLDNLLFAYGHDEYLYQMLVANKTTLPPEGLAMVRYHSAYPWHTGKAYKKFMTEHDEKMMEWFLYHIIVYVYYIIPYYIIFNYNF